MRESYLYARLPDRKVRCDVCLVRCVIPDGHRGACGTRTNREGTLYTLLYGRTSSVCADPIEKKPLFHFYPGTMVLSMGTRGCNFHCPGCQNWEISHDRPDDVGGNLEELDPVASVDLAERTGCAGICWTYNDPTIWVEHTHEAMVEAWKRGLYTCYITNGYATREHLDLVGPYLTAWRLDLKGFSRESYKAITKIARWEELLEIAARAKHHWGMHVEVVTNVTPTKNDDPALLRDMARWIRDTLGPFTPWHLTRFFPYLDLSHLPPTPIRTLEQAAEIGREEGLHYVYIGNVPGHPWENTYCHACGALVIERHHFAVRRARVFSGTCSSCGTQIPGRWQTRIEPTTGRRLAILFR